MPAVTTEHGARALRAAIEKVGGLEKLGASTSSLALGAMDWARWEYMIALNKRKQQWRDAMKVKVAGSHVVIYDTRQMVRLDWTDKPAFKYGGSMTGRGISGWRGHNRAA